MFTSENEDMDVSVPMPVDLKSLLCMNCEKMTSQAALLKIIASHFSGRDINMQTRLFIGMD
jgi:hypothetical protein